MNIFHIKDFNLKKGIIKKDTSLILFYSIRKWLVSRLALPISK